MLAKAVLTDEERAVDRHLGFPRGYAKLCRHAHMQAQGLFTPFTEGPPQRFHPYAPQDEEIAKFKGYDDLFPILDEEHRDTTNPKKYIESLWQQLDHMGNAGFDPAVFRIDVYGNVLYWDADPGSPLAWEVDHWFPHSRGGLTVPGNLRLVQWQACHRKRKKLEFLVPWWDLQLGVSANQFLSVFASKNSNFRHRAFCFFFLSGENEKLNNNKVVQGHSWPRHFRDRKNQVGLAAAALVHVQKAASEGALRSLNTNYGVPKQEDLPAGSAGHCEDAVRRDLQNLGLEYWKDDKDKHSRKGIWAASDKENKGLSTDKLFTISAAHLRTEQQWKQSMEEEKKQKMEESVQLEEELQKMKAQNVKEKAVLDQLEQALAKQKKRVEKQRRWSETQSQYRLCLEKMIRDTLHQCVVYKEQARLNQAACNALLARLELQKSTCDAAEMDLVRKVKQREDLEALARPKITKRVRHQGHTDVGSCLKPTVVEVEPPRNTHGKPLTIDASSEEEENSNKSKGHLHSRTSRRQPNRIEGKDITADHDRQELRTTCPKLLVREKYSAKVCDNHVRETSDMHINGQKLTGQCAEEMGRELQDWPIKEGSGMGRTIAEQGIPGIKRKALEVSGGHELDVVLLGYEYQENEGENANREESVGDNGTTHNSIFRNCSDEDEDDAANKDAHDEYDESNNADNVSEREMESFEAGEECQASLGDAKTCDDRQWNDLLEGQLIAEKTKDDGDGLLQEVLVMQDKVNEAMVEAIREEQDEERVKRVGKLNLDKWLQKLLLDSGYGQGEEPTLLTGRRIIPHRADISLEGEKRIDPSAIERNRGFTQIEKVCNPDEEKETRDCPTVGSADSELVESVRGGMIGGLLKKLSFKNGSASGVDDNEGPRSTVSAEKIGDLAESKKRGERHTSPWRWVSPVSKRSTSAGGETRPRRLSPWRRNSREDKVEERKMMEGFSKLKLGGDRRQVEGAIVLQKDEVCGTSLKPKLQSQTPPSAQGVRERSTSTPPLITQCSRLAPSPKPSCDALTTKVRPFAIQVHRRKDNGGTRGDVGGAKCTMSRVGSTDGGAARKASMLKKTTSTRGSRGSNEDMGTWGVGRGGRLEEDNAANKASLFEDVDPQDNLRASLSMAWKKAVKKFELGRLPSSSPHLPGAHLEL